MKHFFDPVVRSAEDLQAVASKMIRDGTGYFRTQIGNLQLFSSPQISTSEDLDESHYLLIPDQRQKDGFCLFHTRCLPEGIGPENNLAQKRIFHLPDLAHQEQLTAMLLAETKSKKLRELDLSSPLADRLELIADEIDHQRNLVTGGMVIIGGAIAIANPALGLGLAAKSLFPTLGAKLSTHGVKYASDWIRDRHKKSANDSAAKAAKISLKKLKPESRENKVLALLSRATHSQAPDFDPIIESLHLWDDPHLFCDHRIAAEAIIEIFRDTDDLKPAPRKWINHLRETIQNISP
jgi:hypothetical protein